MNEIRSGLGAEGWDYSVFYRVRLLSPFRYMVQGIRTFLKLVESQPEVVVVQNPPIFAALTCLIYNWFYAVKVVVDHHSIWSMGGFIKNPVLKSFIHWVEQFCVGNVDLNTTYADDWESELKKMGAERTLTVYDFVDEQWAQDADFSILERLRGKGKVVVMPCGGHVLERPDLLIEALKDVDATVVITGERRFLERHVARARELGAENVVFTGFLPDGQYRGVIAGCDFAANISEQPFGIPHMVTEALASKRPVIVGENPALAKLLGNDCPFVIPDRDVETTRRTFLSAFENQGEFERLAAELYERLKRRREEQVGWLLEVLGKGEG